MRKRFFASLLALGMLLSLVTGTAWAAEADGSQTDIPVNPWNVTAERTAAGITLHFPDLMGGSGRQRFFRLLGVDDTGFTLPEKGASIPAADIISAWTGAGDQQNYAIPADSIKDGATQVAVVEVQPPTDPDAEPASFTVLNCALCGIEDAPTEFIAGVIQLNQAQKDKDGAITVQLAADFPVSELWYKLGSGNDFATLGPLDSWTPFSAGSSVGPVHVLTITPAVEDANATHIAIAVAGPDSKIYYWAMAEIEPPAYEIKPLTVRAEPCSQPQPGKVALTITGGDGAELRYKIVQADTEPQRPAAVPDDWAQWSLVSAIPGAGEFAAANNSWILVAAAEDGILTHWGVSNRTNDGFAAVPCTLTVKAVKTVSGEVTLTYPSGGENQYYYKLSSADDFKAFFDTLNGGSAFAPGADWKLISPASAIMPSDTEEYIAVVEAGADGRPIQWGSAKITVSKKPAALTLAPAAGGVGEEIAVSVTNGHWITVQVTNNGAIAITSMKATGSTEKVPVTFSAPNGSTVKVWETKDELQFDSDGAPTNQILSVSDKITLGRS